MPGKNRKPQKPTPAQSWNLKEIQDLLDLLIEREINEFELKKGGVKIRVARGQTRSEPQAGGVYSDGPFTLPSAPQTTNLPPVPSGVAEPSIPEPPEDQFIIKSPIVGTFFASPSPNAPPFVKVGDNVDVGQVLCIIEAMKLMNEIESETAGEVVRIYVENGQPVEYGQNLFAIRPQHKKS